MIVVLHQRRRLPALIAGVLVAASSAFLGSAGPALADPSGTVTVTTECLPDGSPSDWVTLTEAFTGLTSGGTNPGYQVVMTVQTPQGPQSFNDDTSYWFPDDAAGDRNYTGERAWGLTLARGTSYSWVLESIFGTITDVATGAGTSSGSACSATLPPKPAKPVVPCRILLIAGHQVRQVHDQGAIDSGGGGRGFRRDDQEDACEGEFRRAQQRHREGQAGIEEEGSEGAQTPQARTGADVGEAAQPGGRLISAPQRRAESAEIRRPV